MAIGLSDYAMASQDSYQDKTVVWVWLGGPTQFETFMPPMTQFLQSGNQLTALWLTKPILLGADWTELSKHTSKLNVVNFLVIKTRRIGRALIL